MVKLTFSLDPSISLTEGTQQKIHRVSIGVQLNNERDNKTQEVNQVMLRAKTVQALELAPTVLNTDGV